MKLPKELSEVFELIKDKAEKQKVDAGRAGEWGDGGYRETMEQIEMFEAGYWYAKNGLTPKWLEEAFKEVRGSKDPEYKEYTRLKEKFEN